MDDTAELFHLTRSSLLSFATSILKNQEDAQDVVQEVFRECLEQTELKINRPYLFKAVRNRSLNKIRTYKRFTRAIERFADYLQIFDEVNEGEFTIMDLMDKLPEKQREVLLLRIKAELKISEIAQVLDIPEGTVKSRINKGLKYLKSNVERK
jgi:RNA polymerase sigma-70 factor (ECF subfamily)